jgi:hypothetical protein
LVNRLSAVYLRNGPTQCRTRAILDPGTLGLHQPLKTRRLHPRPSCSPRSATRRASRTRVAQATLVHLGTLRQRCPSHPPGQEAFEIFSVPMPRVMLRHYPTSPARRATIQSCLTRPRNARQAMNDGPSTSTTGTPPGPTAGKAEQLRAANILLLIKPFHEDDQWIKWRTTE